MDDSMDDVGRKLQLREKVIDLAGDADMSSDELLDLVLDVLSEEALTGVQDALQTIIQDRESHLRSRERARAMSLTVEQAITKARWIVQFADKGISSRDLEREVMESLHEDGVDVETAFLAHCAALVLVNAKEPVTEELIVSRVETALIEMTPHGPVCLESTKTMTQRSPDDRLESLWFKDDGLILLS